MEIRQQSQRAIVPISEDIEVFQGGEVWILASQGEGAATASLPP